MVCPCGGPAPLGTGPRISGGAANGTGCRCGIPGCIIRGEKPVKKRCKANTLPDTQIIIQKG